jgi:hypothetical protein
VSASSGCISHAGVFFFSLTWNAGTMPQWIAGFLQTENISSKTFLILPRFEYIKIMGNQIILFNNGHKYTAVKIVHGAARDYNNKKNLRQAEVFLL